MTVAEAEPNPGYMEFYKLQEQSARERDFMASHQKSWIHGVPNTYNILEYVPFESSVHNSSYDNGLKHDFYFEPKVLMNKVLPSRFKTRHSSTTSESTSGKSSKYEQDFCKVDNSSPFSGLFHIPAFAYSYPGRVVPQDLSGYVYQTHFEVGEITYMFGGMFQNPSVSLQNLGISRSTDLSRISVHLPTEMPPYVNKEVLMSPLMAQNPILFIFNPTRGTVTAYDMETLGLSHPGQLCQMKGTLISSTQIFFCGGFEVKVDSVRFDNDIKRWIVKKRIVINDTGFILDVTRMKFTQIELKTKLDFKFSGRLGSCLVSNSFDRPIIRDQDVPLPIGTADLTAPYVPQPELFDDDATNNQDTKKEQAPLKVKNPVSKKEVSRQSQANTSSSSSTNRVSVRVATEQTPQRNVSSSSSGSKQSDYSKQSGSPLSPTASGSATSLKVSTIFHKSTRMFHRSGMRHSGQAPIQSAYSEQVKQHRSQTLQGSQSSRPASPLRLSLKSPTNRLTPDILSGTSESTDTESVHSDQSAAHATPLATPTPRKLHNRVGSPEKSLDGEEESVTSAESANYRSFIYPDTALRSGVISVCVYQFGGFKQVVDDTGASKLVTTNELLKIELIVDDPAHLVFHPEALVFDMTTRSLKSLWPSLRGYFASALVENDSTSDTCGLMDTMEYLDNGSSKSLTSISDVLSMSEKSTGKSHGSYSADSFFERKALMVHGGVNDKAEVFGEMYLFNFATERWLEVLTYAFDYYDIPKLPFEDENTELLTLEGQVNNPKLMDAELRCCHHQALLIKEDGREYVTFLGGFTNDYLRHFETVPYQSPKFDVSRIARFTMSCTNANLLRVPMLNLRSQTWKFNRFFYDLSKKVTPDAMDLLMGNEYLRNSRMCFSGGAFSIVGKQITICHGLAHFVPEKAEDFDKVYRFLDSKTFILGGHCHLAFPNM